MRRLGGGQFEFILAVNYGTSEHKSPIWEIDQLSWDFSGFSYWFQVFSVSVGKEILNLEWLLNRTKNNAVMAANWMQERFFQLISSSQGDMALELIIRFLMIHNLPHYRFVKMFGPSGVAPVLGTHGCPSVRLILRADRGSLSGPITVLVWKSCGRFVFVFVCDWEVSDAVFVVETIISEVSNDLVNQTSHARTSDDMNQGERV